MSTWRDIRRIRASFPTNARTLYMLNSNSFQICNWAKQDLSCPVPACATAGPALACYIFWTCPSARRHWAFLLDRWRWLGTFQEADLHVLVFGLELPGVPFYAWDLIKQSMDPGADLIYQKLRLRSSRQLVSCGVLSSQRPFIPFGSSASSACKTHMYYRMFTQLVTILYFAGRFEGFVDQPTSPTWG